MKYLKRCKSRGFQKAASNEIPGMLNVRSKVNYTVVAKKVKTNT